MCEETVMYDVFVSHNRKQKPWVREFTRHLRDGGLKVFFDEDSIEPGANVVKSLEDALMSSRHVVLVLSPESLKSEWVALETTIAIYNDPAAAKRVVIPILLEPVDDSHIRPALRILNHVDLTRADDRSTQLIRLLSSLGVSGRLPDLSWPAPSGAPGPSDDEEAAAVREFTQLNGERSLDEWYAAINRIYWRKNAARQRAEVFSHLVEVAGGISLLASEKKKKAVTGESFIPKTLAWWFAVCGSVHIRSVSDVLWGKFPGVCPYCHEKPCDSDICPQKKLSRLGPDWEALAALGRKNSAERPSSLGGWQRMFAKIYRTDPAASFAAGFARLMEEIGELAEAVRVYTVVPGYVLSEAADVFAWLMKIQNMLDHKRGVLPDARGPALQAAVCAAYPDRCNDCRNPVCSCEMVLKATIGRIAHEVPPGRATFGSDGAFMTQEEVSRKFAS
jgi:TIR domain